MVDILAITLIRPGPTRVVDLLERSGSTWVKGRVREMGDA